MSNVKKNKKKYQPTPTICGARPVYANIEKQTHSISILL